MPEQFKLDLPNPEEQIEAAGITDLEKLDTQEIEKIYQEYVGIDPQFRFLGIPETERRGILITGIENPEAERDRIAALDREADKEELKRPYLGRQ